MLLLLTLPPLFFDSSPDRLANCRARVVRRGRASVVIELDLEGVALLQDEARAALDLSLVKPTFAPMLASTRRTLLLCEKALVNA